MLRRCRQFLKCKLLRFPISPNLLCSNLSRCRRLRSKSHLLMHQESLSKGLFQRLS